MAQPVPEPRGELSATVIDILGRCPGSRVPSPAPAPDDPLRDEDLQLALYLCYELHYTGVEGADPDWEWDPGLLCLRREMEKPFEAQLREITDRGGSPDDAVEELRNLASSEDGPSLSEFVESRASEEQFGELCIHRSGWQLKEADPHTWAVMRLTGRAKAALAGLQFDEYGAGEPRDVHSTLFAESMRSLGLDDTYGAYVGRMPAITLATVNLVSLLGLHRRLRAALVGHLALFETTSVGPMAHYSRALARLGRGDEARRFFDVHVVADARHGEAALDEVVGGLLESEPSSGPEIVFGARALKDVEQRFTEHVLESWDAGRSSLR